MKTKKTPAAETSLAPDAVEVAAPLVSSEENGTVSPSRMRGSFLTVDSVMDASPITFKFRAKNTLTEEIEKGLVFEDIVDSSGESGARRTPIPLKYLTKAMGFTLVVWYEGTVNGKSAVSLSKDVGIDFYSTEQGKMLAPRLIDEKIYQNTPTYDMHDHEGDEIVEIPLPDLAQQGDKVYCTVVIEQFSGKPAFYTVAYDYALTADDIASGGPLTFPIARGWLARQKPRYESLTCQAAWITSGLPAQPPAEVGNPNEETRLPRNALEIQHRRTASFIGDQGLEDLQPPHLHQSTQYNNTWCLNPELTKEGGDVGAPGLDTYAGDQICFYVSGSNYDKKSLGCVSIEHDGDQPSVKLPACVVACFFNQSMTLTYTVQFPNSAEPQESPKREISVSVPEFTFSDIEEVTAEKLDLSTFQGNANATVPAWAYAECSNTCWMWITGKREDGGDHQLDILVGASVTDEWKRQGVRTSISRQGLQTLADCSKFELHFAVSFCDADDFEHACKFPIRTFEIEQEPLALVAPAVSEAVGSNLIAWNGRNGVHVEVNYVGIGPQHSISVCWKKPNGTCWVLPSKPGSMGEAVSFALPAEAVIESMGKTVPITYAVTTACKVQTSPPLNLTISLPTRLETPNVLEATPPRTQNAILDLHTFTGNANSLQDGRSTNGQMWFLRAGQKCWLRVTGTGKNGSPYSFVVYAGRTITEQEVTVGVTSPVLRSELEKLKNDTSVSLTFSVATDGSLNENVICPSRELKVSLSMYDFTSFTGNNWNGWLPGAAANGEMVYYSAFGKPCVANGTAYIGGIGAVLYKDFTGLQSGRTYEFSILACALNAAPVKPRLSLRANVAAVTPVTVFSEMAWKPLKGTFVASATSMRLEIWSHEAQGTDGNDYGITDILVK